MVDLSITIVSFNSRKYLDQCLKSICKDPTEVSHELIIVDNHSSDGSVEFVQRAYPKVRIIINKENRGFAAGNNQAFGVAQGRYLLLLNPDTIVQKGSLAELVSFMDSHDRCGVAGAALLNIDGKAQPTGVKFPGLWNMFVESVFLDRLLPRSRIFGRHKERYEDSMAPRPVDYVQGSCLIVRSSILAEVGSLDERFFMYFEEVDWCWRITEADWQVFLCPAVTIVHIGGETMGHFDEHRLTYYHRGLLLFTTIHYGAGKTVLFRILICWRSLIRLVVWLAVAASQPSLRRTALSSIRGYLGTFRIVVLNR